MTATGYQLFYLSAPLIDLDRRGYLYSLIHVLAS